MKIICFWKKNQKEKLIAKAEEIFANEIDLISILQKLHEVENLKYLILEKEQMDLFNFLTKPVIKIEEQCVESMRRSSTIRRISENKKNNRGNFLESYEKCKADQENNRINKKLIEFCNIKELSLNNKKKK